MAGISIEDFWNMDFDEIQTIFDAYTDKIELENKREASNIYNLSVMIASFVGLSLSGKPLPDISEIYPDLFPKEIDVDSLKNQFAAYAEQFNANRRKKNDT